MNALDKRVIFTFGQIEECMKSFQKMKLNKAQNVFVGERNAQIVREKWKSRRETLDKNLHVTNLVLSQPAGAVTIIKLFLDVLTGM